jgi:hypothetical protein
MRLAKNAEESFTDQSFPTTKTEFLEQHGDVEMELPNGAVTLSEVLDPFPDEKYATEEDLRLATYGALGEEAIGRKGYSDRDPCCPGEQGHDHVSL